VIGCGGMDWAGPNWAGLDWTGLDWTAPDGDGVESTELESIGLDWTRSAFISEGAPSMPRKHSARRIELWPTGPVLRQEILNE
jgi:hypothetical protein